MIRKFMPYIFLSISLVASLSILVQYSKWVPNTIKAEDFFKSKVWTDGIQGRLLEITDELRMRKIDFASKAHAEVQIQGDLVSIEHRLDPNLDQVQYNIDLYFQKKRVMTRPVIVKASLTDLTPNEDQGTFTNFIWDIR